MFVILWEFEVKPGSEVRFEKAYGPTGDWAQLFQRDPHYRGTKLLRDVTRPYHYFTVDYWDLESEHPSSWRETKRRTKNSLWKP